MRICSDVNNRDIRLDELNQLLLSRNYKPGITHSNRKSKIYTTDGILEQSGEYQPSGAGGTCSPPATPHRLPVGPKMADGVWKGVYP